MFNTVLWNNIVTHLSWLVLTGYLSIWSRLLGYKKGYTWADTPVTLGLPKGRSSGRTDIHLSPPSAETTALKCKLNNTLIWPHSNQVLHIGILLIFRMLLGFFLNKNVFIQLMGFKKLTCWKGALGQVTENCQTCLNSWSTSRWCLHTCQTNNGYHALNSTSLIHSTVKQSC